MIKYKKVKRVLNVQKSIVCDCCGHEYDNDDVLEMQEFLKIDFVGGYGSVFGDMMHIQCDICQHCLLELISPHVRIDTMGN